jgi:hypothetical protein
MHVVIYHNKNERSSFFNGYTEGDALVMKYEGDVDLEGGRDKQLETVFYLNQHLDHHSPWYTGRSLSVGDIIVLDGETYAIERVGFKHLKPLNLAGPERNFNGS